MKGWISLGTMYQILLPQTKLVPIMDDITDTTRKL